MVIDWNFWKHMETVKLWQAALLACNIDPDKMNYRDIEYDGLDYVEADKMLRLLKNNLGRPFFSPGVLNMGDSNLHEVRLSEFAAWCLHIDFEIPLQLANLAKNTLKPEATKSHNISNAPKPPTPIKSSYAPQPTTILKAEYKTWCKADLWTVERAILLLLNAETLPSRNSSGRCNTPIEQAIYDDFMKIWQVAESSLKTGVLKKTDKSYPSLRSEIVSSDFINWAKAKDYSIPDELKIIDSIQQDKAAPVIQTDESKPPCTTSADETLSVLFDPVPVESLEKMFPANGKWRAWAEKAKSNGLIVARQERAMFNPYRAGKWFVNKGQDGWDEARLIRALANNLPARSLDEKHQLTGEIN